jgi:hypothetical protein
LSHHRTPFVMYSMANLARHIIGRHLTRIASKILLATSSDAIRVVWPGKYECTF